MFIFRCLNSAHSLSERRSCDRVQYYMEDPSSENSDGSAPWWCIVSFRFFAADIFFQSYCRTFRSRNSSGAKMVVALTMIVYLKYIGRFSSYTLILAAFIGSLISTGFILLMSKKVQHMASLLVGGIMIGYICSAITDFVVTFADDSDIVNLHGWSQGSFSGMSWSNIRVAAVVVGLAVLFTFFLSKPISAYQLGEAYAQSMGVNIKTFRVILILLSSILSACVTAFAGPISFVGIAVPFLARKAFGTSKPIVVIPGTFFMGAVFCMICDLIARMALAPVELNISTVTSILGAPIVIYMMIQKGGRK